MPIELTSTENNGNGRESIKMRPDAVTRLRMLAAKLTLIFGRRVTYQETIDILCGHIDDTTLSSLARDYAQSHDIKLLS
jgi:hypothetical protein